MNLLKTILSTSVFAIASVASVALHAQLPAKVESFPVRDVRLTASPFKHAEDMDIRYPTGRRPENDRKRLSGRKYRLESERRCPANNQPIKFYRTFVAGLGIRCLAQSPSPERKRI